MNNRAQSSGVTCKGTIVSSLSPLVPSVHVWTLPDLKASGVPMG